MVRPFLRVMVSPRAASVAAKKHASSAGIRRIWRKGSRTCPVILAHGNGSSGGEVCREPTPPRCAICGVTPLTIARLHLTAYLPTPSGRLLNDRRKRRLFWQRKDRRPHLYSARAI